MSITFENLNLDSRIIAGLNKQNISVPTSIQQEAIPVILNHQDVIAQSESSLFCQVYSTFNFFNQAFNPVDVFPSVAA